MWGGRGTDKRNRDGEDICEMEDWRRGILILSSSS